MSYVGGHTYLLILHTQFVDTSSQIKLGQLAQAWYSVSRHMWHKLRVKCLITQYFYNKY